MTTTLIQNGLLIDGTGRKPCTGHLLVADDRIREILPGTSPEAEGLLRRGADAVIDANGLAVCPGLIDCHSHFDWVLPLEDHDTFLSPMAEQGVTTVIAGNCGFSPAPMNPGSKTVLAETLDMLLERPFPMEWKTMDGFLRFLEKSDGLLFNLAQLTGHGCAQYAVTGDETAAPDPSQAKAILSSIDAAFDAGSFGLSLGLMYPPGLYSTRKELVTLAEQVARRNRILTVHIRALSRYSGAYPVIPFFGQPHNLRALEEILDVSLQSGARLQISHFIFVGRSSWPTAEKAVAMIEAAADEGVEVMWDLYPHFCGNSYLNVFLPAWFLKNLEKNLASPLAVRRLKWELALARRLLGFDMEDIQIMDAGHAEGETFNGMTLVEIAEKRGENPVDTLLAIVRDSRSKALQLTWGYSGDEGNEELITRLMANARCLFETDTILKSRGMANPASYGAFPRILGHFARDRRALSLTEAVHRMTGATARWFGIAERGELRPGYFADLLLFDPQTIADNTTRRDTACRPAGIHRVFVNGRNTVVNGRYQENSRYGRVLRCT
jgi:N-acyl-D-amino-acid deacylase